MSVQTNSKEHFSKSKQVNKALTTTKPPEVVGETETDANSDQEDIWKKFELELKWCVDQLEAQLSSQKSNQRQALEAAKALKILTNPKAHLIKKRQLMRTAFGDYRLKMKQDELKFNKEMKKISFSAVKPSHQKATFLKRSGPSKQYESVKNAFLENSSNVNEVLKPVFSFKKSDNSFKFNFLIENSDVPI